MRHRAIWIFTLGMAMSACLVVSRNAAAVTVYEGFATGQGGYTSGNIAGQNPNSSSIGLDTATAWVAGTGAGVYNVSATGLTIGSGSTTLTTTGGSLTRTGSVGNTVVYVPFATSNYVGDLYQSVLVNFGGTPNGSVFVSAGQTSSTDGNYKRFKIQAKGSDTDQSLGVQYRTNSNTNGTGNWVSSDTTYIFLSRYTNVGTAHSGVDSGVATVFALTSAQFDHFKAAGFSGIDSATVGNAATQISAKAVDSASGSGTLIVNQTSFPVGGSTGSNDITLALQIYGNPTVSGNLITYDEVRWGSSFDDVTPIPEPNSFVLIGLALSTLTVVRAKSKK